MFSFDNYAFSPHENSFYNSVARSVSNPFWILEQAAGHPAGQYIWPDERPPLMDICKEAVRRGCELVSARWRQGLFGCEQDHGALLDHDGKPGWQYKTTKEVMQSLKGAREEAPRSDVAVLMSWEDGWTCNARRMG